jgi:hypothetical protein
MQRAWRALLPVQRGLSLRSMSTAASSSALEFLSQFVNYERKGVPTHAGMDTAEGFDLVSQGAQDRGLTRQGPCCSLTDKRAPLALAAWPCFDAHISSVPRLEHLCMKLIGEAFQRPLWGEHSRDAGGGQCQGQGPQGPPSLGRLIALATKKEPRRPDSCSAPARLPCWRRCAGPHAAAASPARGPAEALGGRACCGHQGQGVHHGPHLRHPGAGGLHCGDVHQVGGWASG